MNKTILVTGGSRGIGRGICVELARRGWSVGINYAGNREAAEKTLALCREAATDAEQKFAVLQADITDADARKSMVAEAYRFFGRLDALVNNAGIAPAVRADLLEMGEDSFDRVMGVNLKAPFFLTQLVAARWSAENDTDGKSIVFISSISADTVSVNRGEYCISKAGTAMAVSLFAARLAEANVGVYEVRPGIIKTDMTAAVESKYDKLIEEGLVPQKRWGLPDDLGKVVSALVGGDFAFATGSVIPVDGGLHIRRL